MQAGASATVLQGRLGAAFSLGGWLAIYDPTRLSLAANALPERLRPSPPYTMHAGKRLDAA